MTSLLYTFHLYCVTYITYAFNWESSPEVLTGKRPVCGTTTRHFCTLPEEIGMEGTRQHREEESVVRNRGKMGLVEATTEGSESKGGAG